MIDIVSSEMQYVKSLIAAKGYPCFSASGGYSRWSRMMRARCLSFPHGSNPEALLQIAQHETPELVLQPRYMQHPNGAISIT